MYSLQLEEREQGTWDENFKPEGLITIEDMFPKKTKCLIDFIDDYVIFRKKQGTVHNTVKEFITCKNRLDNFDKDRGQKTSFEDISITWSDKFEQYLRKKEYMDAIKEVISKL